MLTMDHVETMPTGAETVDVRPLEHGDRDTLLAIFSGLGDRSRALRFLTAKPRLTETDLRRLTSVDGHDHVALVAVATTDDRPLGIARFIRDPHHPESADVAVEVIDAWQGRGIGTLLTNALARRAAEVGVRRFTMTIACGNRPARRLADHGTQVTRVDLYAGTEDLVLLLPRDARRPRSDRLASL
jgi:GNAT superfamily N-acetyltransferase